MGILEKKMETSIWKYRSRQEYMGIHGDNDRLRIDSGLERGVTRVGFRAEGSFQGSCFGVQVSGLWL